MTGHATARYGIIRDLRKEVAETVPGLPVHWLPLPGRLAGAGLGRKLFRGRIDRMLNGVALAHATSFIAPGWLPTALPTVLTIHDLAFLRYPQAGFGGLGEGGEKALQNAVDAAAAVITISEFSKREIVELLGVEEGKVFVTPLAAQWVAPPQRAALPPSVFCRLGITPTRYFLSVGSVSPRKNYGMLLDAFDVCRSLAPALCLVVIGDEGWGCDEERKRLAATPGVIWLKSCTASELAAFYQWAVGLVFPSWYEGFGIPAVEAMTMGCPVCYSRGHALDEVIRGAGIGFAPDAVAEIRDAMMGLWNNRELRQQLGDTGRQRAATFSWDITAERTLEVYAKVAAGRVAKEGGALCE